MPDAAAERLASRLSVRPAARLLAGLVAVVLPLEGAAAQTAPRSHCFAYGDPPRTHVSAAFWADMTYRTINTPNGRVLLAEGAIKPNEAQRLEQALAGAGAIDEVWVASPGGAALEGPRMGRVIRRRGIATRLPANRACISACTYAFLGGPVRIVEPGAYYGVHMFTGWSDAPNNLRVMQAISDVNTQRQTQIRAGQNAGQVNAQAADIFRKFMAKEEQEAAQLAADQARYLVEMALSLDFMTDIFGTKAEDVCYLSAAGLRHYNVSNAE